MLGDDTFRHADGAGWYDCTLRRTPQGWRFVTVAIREVWNAGEPLPHTGQPGAAVQASRAASTRSSTASHR
jgi:hypothetical protein